MPEYTYRMMMGRSPVVPDFMAGFGAQLVMRIRTKMAGNIFAPEIVHRDDGSVVFAAKSDNHPDEVCDLDLGWYIPDVFFPIAGV